MPTFLMSPTSKTHKYVNSERTYLPVMLHKELTTTAKNARVCSNQICCQCASI